MHLIPIPWTLLLTAFGIAFLITLLATPWVTSLAKRYRLFDLPSARRVHTSPIPRIGGLALFLGFFIALLVVFGFDPRILGLALCAILIFGLGLLDDIYSLPPILKFTGQLVVASLAVFFGITIGNITNPFGGTILLSPIFDVSLTIVWMLLMINTVNFLDGLDGLATGVTAIVSVVLVVLSLFTIVDQPQTAALAAMICGTALGFLYYNWHPAKIFMGDGGSHLLGFMLAAISIISGGKIATAVLALGLPVLDLVWAIVRRLKTGKAPWSADKLHLHHLLLSAGLGQRTVVTIFYVFTLGFGTVALLSGTWSKLVGLLIVGLLMAGIVRVALYFRPQQR
ncbi:MAG: MraY family glycosyltransferase [Patescibacteria group bacterium]|jgi:UDP-GlcNAc:undecaprenyl-phosphate GlcNAc-1-phosphate transferase